MWGAQWQTTIKLEINAIPVSPLLAAALRAPHHFLGTSVWGANATWWLLPGTNKPKKRSIDGDRTVRN
jgi:hypothetical protein